MELYPLPKLTRRSTFYFFPNPKYKNEMLGRSLIKESGCNGNDIANIPQRNKIRKICGRYDKFEDTDRKAEKLAWKYHEQGKELPKNAIGQIVDLGGDAFSYDKYYWVDELREKEENEQAEKIFKGALAQIENFKIQRSFFQ